MKFRRNASSEEISGFLDQGTALTGELQFSGTLRIDGSFHGSITTNDMLVVGENAVVHADIKAGEIEVHGRVFGNIEAQRRVELYPQGQIRGDIQSPVLVVNAGGSFDGRSCMTSESDPRAQSSERVTVTQLAERGVDEAH